MALTADRWLLTVSMLSESVDRWEGRGDDLCRGTVEVDVIQANEARVRKGWYAERFDVIKHAVG